MVGNLDHLLIFIVNVQLCYKLGCDSSANIFALKSGLSSARLTCIKIRKYQNALSSHFDIISIFSPPFKLFLFVA